MQTSDKKLISVYSTLSNLVICASVAKGSEIPRMSRECDNSKNHSKRIIIVVITPSLFKKCAKKTDKQQQQIKQNNSVL